MAAKAERDRRSHRVSVNDETYDALGRLRTNGPDEPLGDVVERLVAEKNWGRQ